MGGDEECSGCGNDAGCKRFKCVCGEGGGAEDESEKGIKKEIISDESCLGLVRVQVGGGERVRGLGGMW